MASKKTMKVRVQSGIMETADGQTFRQGDIIEIPASKKQRTQQQRWGLRSGNLKPIPATMDLPPVVSEDTPTDTGE